jgi:membrane protease YdiL (CAAX protease family)
MFFKKLTDRFFHRGRLSIRHVLALFSFIFVAWGLYRYFPEITPLWVEELILKPLLWVVPTLWLVKKIEGESWASLGLVKKNLKPSIYWGIGLGFVFALEGLLTNIFKYRGLNLVTLDYSPLAFLGLMAISFVTAFSEELVFRGYIFTRLSRILKNEWLAVFISAIFFALIYLPVVVFVLSYQPVVMLAYLLFVFIYGFASAFVFARTGNLMASILLHIFWSWPIILFR